MKSIAHYINREKCPVIRTMTVIGGKWKPVILYCLADRRLRFGQLGALLPAISKRMLSRELKELEGFGLVNREVKPDTQRGVEYNLTQKGYTVIPIIDAMCEWARTDGSDIKI